MSDTVKDWRVEYVICEHIAADAGIEAFHRGFRVCCRVCADKNFLICDTSDLIMRDTADKLCVGTFKKR